MGKSDMKITIGKREYELKRVEGKKVLFADGSILEDEVYGLVPIKSEEKKEYRLRLDEYRGGPDIFNEIYELTEAQATAIFKAIEALMEYVQLPSYDKEVYSNQDTTMERARELMGDNNASNL